MEIAPTEDTSERMLAAPHRGELGIAVTGLADEEPSSPAGAVFLNLMRTSPGPA
ncbi:hypothetical protein ACGF8B_34390 [Streptomyces sp. NPDC047917]|uniref:hypothetical protein n=1 Tax=Streptomyces sp. NPDC047917 TaxID=3365491 RepID=UPI003716270D